jgi:lipid-binding SYLF domain-containing protein
MPVTTNVTGIFFALFRLCSCEWPRGFGCGRSCFIFKEIIMNVRKASVVLFLSSAFLGTVTLPGCSTTPTSEEARDNLRDDANASLSDMKRTDPGVNDVLRGSVGYVIFPNVGEGAAGVGAGYGRGMVYENGKFIGYADISKGTVGAQLGAQTFSELIVFQTQQALDNLKNNKFELSATASAVAIRAGAAANAKFENGVGVFTRPVGGLMFEASVGGQQFTFTAN